MVARIDCEYLQMHREINVNILLVTFLGMLGTRKVMYWECHNGQWAWILVRHPEELSFLYLLAKASRACVCVSQLLQ